MASRIDLVFRDPGIVWTNSRGEQEFTSIANVRTELLDKVMDDLCTVLGLGDAEITDELRARMVEPNPILQDLKWEVQGNSVVEASGRGIEIGRTEPPAVDPSTLQAWDCTIGGPITDLPLGADGPMRRAVAEAYEALTGREPMFCFSGWGAKLDAGKLEVIRSMSEPAVAPHTGDEAKDFGSRILNDINKKDESNGG